VGAAAPCCKVQSVRHAISPVAVVRRDTIQERVLPVRIVPGLLAAGQSKSADEAKPSEKSPEGEPNGENPEVIAIDGDTTQSEAVRSHLPRQITKSVNP
jgi:hypothetical protein